jgi:hypothetical protein
MPHFFDIPWWVDWVIPVVVVAAVMAAAYWRASK